MEDYVGAYGARKLDVSVLETAVAPRCIAATHVGGVAVECKLKSLLLAYHGISEWDQLGNRPKDPNKGYAIKNPGHSLLSALRKMPTLYAKAKSDPEFLTHLSRVLQPVGSTGMDFISMRYVAAALSAVALADWKKSFRYVTGWLEKNGSAVL